MNEKEISEIRRRFREDKSNISRIRGCYVNEKGEIISEFNESLGLMSQAESEEILAVLKKTLSGAVGKNLIDIEFSNEQVLAGAEHKSLMAMRNSSLEDDNAISEFYSRVIESVNLKGNYLILLSCDKYDTFAYSKDGKKSEDSSSIFSYILCSICPVKMTKPALSYYAHENAFHNIAANSVVGAPELGFMFPTFDDRTANIYNALYYSHNISENHQEFVDAVFKSELPMPATVQKETFQSILSDAVSEECNYDVVQTVHEQICEMIEEHKANKEEEPLRISKKTVKDMLNSCGVDESKLEAFEENYDVKFGADTKICPQNIVDIKQFEVCTSDVTIKVNSQRSDLVETRVIDGTKYIMIRADESVTVNGVNIHIS
ncbi:MAG: DUF4317 domain-containing protein [Oscillospiraceae bacterium]